MIVKIKNYQRLEDITLDLKPGINLISGNSNNGKSSTIRAIRDFIFNKATKDKIRHGEKEMSITLDNATLNRNSKGTTYTINDNTFEKVGKNPLNEVIDLFNIKELTVNGVTIKPNFWFQMDKPFLIDKTAGQKHDLIIGAKNDKYLKALKEIKSEISNLTKVEKVSLEKVIDTLKKKNLETNTKLNKLEGIDELVEKAIKVEKGKNFIDKNINLTKSIVELNKNIKVLKVDLEQINSLNYRTILDKYSKLEDMLLQLDEITFTYNKYKILKYETESLEEKLNKLNPLYNKSQEFLEGIEKLKNKELELAQIELVNNLVKLTKENIEEGHKKIKVIELELQNKKDEFNNFKKEIKICPLCGGELK